MLIFETDSNIKMLACRKQFLAQKYPLLAGGAKADKKWDDCWLLQI
jgi:hypothetical protein